MTTTEENTTLETAAESERVMLLVSDRGNRRVLEEWLDDHERYTFVETDEISETTFDCCLLDRQRLFQHTSELLARKESEQVILPYLLLVPESRHREVRNRLQDEHPELWDAIDGLVDMPIAEHRLEEQLETFLRLREQSISTYEQSEQLRQIRDQHAGHGVVITDSDGTIEYVNEAFEVQAGYTSEEVIGKNPRLLSSGEHDEAFYEDLWDTITAGEVWKGIVINERKDGTQYVIDQTIAPVEVPDGEIEQFVAANHEITELKELEERLREQRKQLDVLNRVLRHDIRNDMNVVLAWAELLEDEVTSEGQGHLDRILRAGRHVVELTNVARDLSAIIHGDENVELDTISLNRVLREEVEKRRETFTDAEITMLEPSEPGIHVLANELLSSVFRNLINNAIQHNDAARPVVTISVVKPADETVRVRVADNGPGIPDEMKERLFGQGEKGLESEGTGIGLFLVKSLVESYGGDVWIEDREESGIAGESGEDGQTGAVFIVELRTTTARATGEGDWQ